MCHACSSPPTSQHPLHWLSVVYQKLKDNGLEANSTTYNALISAYGKLGQLEKVLEVYKDMVWRGLDRRWDDRELDKTPAPLTLCSCAAQILI